MDLWSEFGQRGHGEGQLVHFNHLNPDPSFETVPFSPTAVHESMLMTIGAENQAAQKWSGVPFNRPTQAVVSAYMGKGCISAP